MVAEASLANRIFCASFNSLTRSSVRVFVFDIANADAAANPVGATTGVVFSFICICCVTGITFSSDSSCENKKFTNAFFFGFFSSTSIFFVSFLFNSFFNFELVKNN